MGELVGADGKPRIGAWDRPLVDPNLEDAKISHALERAGDYPGLSFVERMYRQRFRLKSWQYMTAVTDDLFMAFVVGTAGFAGNGFVYAAELPSGKVHEKFVITPLSVGVTVAPSSARGTHRIAAQGLSIQIDSLEGGTGFTASIQARTKAGGRLDAELAFTSDAADQHLALCIPIPDGRYNYTHKYAGFHVTGRVLLDDRRVDFAPGRSFGAMDFTKMYAQRHAVWKWIALAGTTRRGARIGLNLVDPTPDAPISENALWIDGKRDAIANVIIEAREDSWAVSADPIELAMQPVAQVSQSLDVPLVRHELRHIVGRFSGQVRTTSGQIHDLDNLVGIAEDWDTWW
jgi:hypothetical protein